MTMSVKLIAATLLMNESREDLLPYVQHPLIFNDDGYGVSKETPSNADELAEIAGRLCYKSWKRPNPATATNAGYLGNIIGQSHFSVLEHASATFWISGVSRSLTHELVRHRHLSFSQVSQRYVDESEGEYVEHPAIEAAKSGYGSNALANAVNEARDRYVAVVRWLMTEYGLDRKTARGAARGFLPNAVATELIVTGNHRAWREMLSKRLGPGADDEIRLLAQSLLKELVKVAPNTYQDFLEGAEEVVEDAPAEANH